MMTGAKSLSDPHSAIQAYAVDPVSPTQVLSVIEHLKATPDADSWLVMQSAAVSAVVLMGVQSLHEAGVAKLGTTLAPHDGFSDSTTENSFRYSPLGSLSSVLFVPR